MFVKENKKLLVDINGNIKINKMNKLDLDYQNLLKDILENGTKKETRNGGTISVFGRQIRHKMSDGFPLLTTKKMPFKTIVTELLWFLRGDTNIKFLVDNGCHIWDGDAYKAFCNERIYIHNKVVRENSETDFGLWEETISKEEFINKIKTDDEFAKKWGSLGKIYGHQWRNWAQYNLSNHDTYVRREGMMNYRKHKYDVEIKHIDQIANSINLLKTDPDSRRNRVNAWNVGELDQMVLPPCHTDFQFFTRELSLKERGELFRKTYPNKSVDDFKPNGMEIQSMTHQLSTRYDNANIPTRAISLMWNQRSVDTFLGLPFNIASYGLLLEIIAKEVNMVPDELIGNLGDTHLYLNHIEQAKEQIGRELTLEERIERMYQINEKDSEHLFTQTDPSHHLFDNLNVPKRTREPFELPTITLPSSLQPNSGNWDKLVFEDFYLNDYKSHPTIKAPLSN
jgi:thymidylate synthase